MLIRERLERNNGAVIVVALLALAIATSTFVTKGPSPGPVLFVIVGLGGLLLIIARRLWGLAILLGSYTYCLPVIYYHFLGEHPLRLYDLVAIAILLAFLGDILLGKPLRIAKSQINKPLFYFVGFCLFSLVLVAVKEGMLRVPVAGLRWFRLFAYVSGFVFVSSVVKTKRQIRVLLGIFVAAAVVQGLLSSLQSLGFLGPFWDYEKLGMYTPSFYVGTMGPHHLHLRLYAITALAVLVARAKMPGTFWGKLGLAVCSGLLIYPLFNTHCRTGILMFLVYGATTLLFSRKRGIGLLGIVIGALVLFWAFGTAPFEIGQTRVEKAIHKMQTPTGYDPTRLDQGRMRVYRRYASRIKQDPTILLLGKGFEFGWGGAHNCYMQVFIELGPFGLVIYLWLLVAIWKRARWVSAHSPDGEGRILAREFLCVYVAILVANGINEVLYVQRALYSYLGQFLFLTALVLHPVWGKPERRGPHQQRSNLTGANGVIGGDVV